MLSWAQVYGRLVILAGLGGGLALFGLFLADVASSPAHCVSDPSALTLVCSYSHGPSFWAAALIAGGLALAFLVCARFLLATGVPSAQEQRAGDV